MGGAPHRPTRLPASLHDCAPTRRPAPTAAPRAPGGGHPALSRLRPALKALPDLERGITRAFHGNARPSDFAALLQQFAGLQAALGLGTGLAEQQAAAEGGAHAGAEASAEAGSSTAEAAEASGAAPSQQRRLAGLQDVASPLLAQLLRAAGDPAVAAAAQRMLDCLDLSAVAANDKLGVLRWVGLLRWARMPHGDSMPVPACPQLVCSPAPPLPALAATATASPGCGAGAASWRRPRPAWRGCCPPSGARCSWAARCST